MKKCYELDLGFLEDRSNRVMNSNSIEECAETAFYEMADDERAIRSKLTRMFEHILKLSYISSENEFNRDSAGWKSSVREPAEYLRNITKGLTDKNLTRKMIDAYPETYLRGVKKYKNASIKNKSLADNIENIPDSIPWEVEDLNNFIISKDKIILSLILGLPDTSGIYERSNFDEFDELDIY